MPYLPSLGLIHVHNPRCGGTSINHALSRAGFLAPDTYSLSPNLDICYGVTEPSKIIIGEKQVNLPRLELDYLPISMILPRINFNLISGITFISTVRHPWSRFTSEFLRKKSTNDKRLISATNASFNEYMEKFIAVIETKKHSLKSQYNASHFWPQYLFANFDPFPEINKSYTIKLDELEYQWYKLQKRLGFRAPLPSKKYYVTPQSTHSQ